MRGEKTLRRDIEMTAKEIRKSADMYKQEEIDLMEETLRNVLNSWAKEARETGKRVWHIEDDDPKWIEAFKIEGHRFSIDRYMNYLRMLGFSVREQYVPATEKGHWFWRRTTRMAYKRYEVRVDIPSPNK